MHVSAFGSLAFHALSRQQSHAIVSELAVHVVNGPRHDHWQVRLNLERAVCSPISHAHRVSVQPLCRKGVDRSLEVRPNQ
jgi:hypothetical protein